MKRFGLVMVNDLKGYLQERAFIKALFFYLVVLSLVVLFGWPGGGFLSFQPPKVFWVLTYVQMIILSHLGGRLAAKSAPTRGTSLEDWLKYTSLTPAEVAMGKIGGIFLWILLIFSSSLPLIILSYFMGGVFFRSALVSCSLLLLPVVAFINFGLLLRFTGTDLSSFILNVFSFLFGLGLFLTRTAEVELFYLNPRFLVFILAVSIFAFFLFLRRLQRLKQKPIL